MVHKGVFCRFIVGNIILVAACTMHASVVYNHFPLHYLGACSISMASRFRIKIKRSLAIYEMSENCIAAYHLQGGEWHDGDLYISISNGCRNAHVQSPSQICPIPTCHGLCFDTFMHVPLKVYSCTIQTSSTSLHLCWLYFSRSSRNPKQERADPYNYAVC